MLKFINLILVFLGCISYGYSQVPAGWNYSQYDYNYSMTITTFIDHDCNELTDTSNIVGAFVGSQCRGYARTNITANGRKLAFLTVYSNSAAGENVTIRFYKASTGQEITAIDGATFLSNAVIGTISSPFVTTTNHRPFNLAVSNLLVLENTPAGGYIGTCSASDIDAGQTLTYSLAGVLDDSSFLVSTDSLLLNTILNFAVQDTYSIVLNVDDGQNCVLTDTFQVVVDDYAFPPVALNDTVTGLEDSTLAIYVLLNDSDYDNNIDTSSVQVISGPDHGTVYVSNGVISYVPAANYFGMDTLVYAVCDLTNTGALCDTAVVFIEVVNVPDPPVALPDSVTTDEEVPVTIDVLANDSDVENDIDTSSLQLVGGPAHGTASVSSGLIYYTPDSSYFGTDTLIYSICDQTVPSPLCDTAMVVIYINNVPDAPEDIIIDTLSITEDNAPDFFISHIYTVDTDLPDDAFVYELVNGINDSDNEQFTIVDNELFINNKTIYEIKNIYHIRVRSTDQFGLNIEKPFDIQVIDIPGNTISLPAATYISNNDDGKNDFFVVENVAIYSNLSLTVYDQFGNEVFYVADHYNNEFDGKQHGIKLPSGAYYYVFKSSTVTYTGNITIVN